MTYLYQFCDSFSFLILSAMGLSIIFGMMGIINLAHGEFIMLGAYITTFFAVRNVPLPISVALGAVGTGVFGFIMDRLIISRLYSRPLDSVVATWGISLVMCQGMRVLFGSSIVGTSTPLGSFTVNGGKFSVYRMVLAAISLVLVAAVYFIFMHTKIGLYARATMQNCAIASSLGVNSNRMYALTFAFGSALAGLCGGLYAPTVSITPDMGSNFMMESFVTVIVGGTNPLVGTVISGGVLGLVRSFLEIGFGTFVGRVGLLIVAIIFIRLVPKGFSGLVENIRKRIEVKKNEKI
ncbi:MAG: branched-chain amino acid ABC transporter permease [Oscillospiraceae bacterium]|nr:branched-chain amino acid ABC transporter permease [Oscillospiraceae bacterium]